MTATSCKLGGLFSIGEDFDDEDLLGTDWAACSSSGPADVTAAVSSCALRASSVAHRAPEKILPQQTGEGSAATCNGTASRSGTRTATGQTVALGLRQLSSSSSPSSFSSSSLQPYSLPPPPTLNNCQPNLASNVNTKEAQDDFDDWDVDLADLEECDSHMGQPPPPAPTVPTSAKTLRPSTCARIETLPPRGLSAPHPQPANPRPAFAPAPPQSPGVFPGLAVTPAPSPASRTLNKAQQPHKPRATPKPSPRGRNLFETVSPAPSPSASSSALSPHPLRTPVLTNRLVQLVSASSNHPKKRPRSEPQRPRTRRFPGPAGLLPQQPQGQNMDQIVVSVPQTPAHGVVARLPNQASSSQPEEEEFSSGAWAAMKAEMGLDERNPSCFLHSFSVVMVLRKAALKQLTKNKVPNMAVVLKSIIHTHADAKVVFKDPTGEIQGTVHRRLLEDRVDELKVGAVLLLKQVGVFSPSHHNHYLNVTPNNLLRIYAPDGVPLSTTPLAPLVLEPTVPSPARNPRVHQEPVSQMQLLFDEEDDEEKDGERHSVGLGDSRVPADTRFSSSRAPREQAGNPVPQDSGWDADDDLDELLGELPEDTYSF